jgi:glycosyltransferase involved in cell wall biosynthesis
LAQESQFGVRRENVLRLAFVSGLSDKKLAQKLAPLQALPEVRGIDLYRRRPFLGEKVRWMEMPRPFSRFAPLGDLWRLVTLVKHGAQYDVLIGCHQRFHGIYAALAGIFRGKPVIQLTITDPAWMEKNFLGGWALRHANAVGFRGHTTLERFGNKHGNRKPLFIPHNVWELPKQAQRNNRSVDLLYVGYLAGYKNISGWLRTAAEVKRRRGRLRAVLVGEKPNRRIRALVNRIGLKNDLEFTGHLSGNELDRRYGDGRVFLLTSFWEGLPMVALEAMTAGLPVVATDVGDVQNLVKDGLNGYLTSVGDVQGAASAVNRLLSDEELWQAMSESARKSAVDFHAKNMLDDAMCAWRKVFHEMGLL